MHTPIVVARDSAMPLHRQIYDEWRRGILAGRFGPGERVPSTRDLAAALEVSRTTVTAAYDQLTAEGYLESQRGSGTFVCRDLPDDALRPSHRVERLPTPARSVRLSRYGRRLEPVIRRSPSAPGVINLSPSSPDADHFPFRLWRRLLHRHLRHLTPSVLGYGANEAGHERLRREIALYVMGRERCTARRTT